MPVPPLREPPATTHALDDLPPANIEAREHRQDAVPPIFVVDATGTTGSHRPARMQAFEDLDLRLLVHTDHPGASGRMQVKTGDPADLPAEVRLGAVEPASDPMGLERGVSEPSRYRGLAGA